jgi:hypothetical protein
MSETLNVLVLESERGAADMATQELEAAGHRVFRCRPEGASAFPCNALRDGAACPLDAYPVDVALTVRARPRSQPAPQEDGVTCALRRHVPVVVAGNPLMDPFSDYVSAEVSEPDDVVGACVRAAIQPLRRHTEAAARATRETLDLRDIELAPLVAVHRVRGGLIVDVAGAAILDHTTKSMLSVRICAALRALDRDARGIDVRFVD